MNIVVRSVRINAVPGIVEFRGKPFVDSAVGLYNTVVGGFKTF